MTTEEMNLAIAEACGWTKIRPTIKGAGAPGRCPSPCGFPPGKNYEASVTNYCGDLNAMRDAGMIIRHTKLWTTYVNTLSRSVGQWEVLQATARQRAEAFLKTIGKWKE